MSWTIQSMGKPSAVAAVIRLIWHEGNAFLSSATPASVTSVL